MTALINFDTSKNISMVINDNLLNPPPSNYTSVKYLTTELLNPL